MLKVNPAFSAAKNSWRETVTQKALPSPKIDISIIDSESELSKELDDYKAVNKQINLIKENIDVVREILAKYGVTKADIIPATTQVEDVDETPIVVHATLANQNNIHDTNYDIKKEFQERLGISIEVRGPMDIIAQHNRDYDFQKVLAEQKAIGRDYG